MMMESLPAPGPLEIHDPNAAELWTTFKQAWEHYSVAKEVSEKSEKIQVATLLTVMGAEARSVFATFKWDDAANSEKMDLVLKKFDDYCQQKKNVPFERYRFNCRQQENGESYDQYRTALLTLAKHCSFDSVTPDEILRDRLVFGIRDTKVRESLLREKNLSLEKTDEICRAAEITRSQLQTMEQLQAEQPTTIHAFTNQNRKFIDRRSAAGRREESSTEPMQKGFQKSNFRHTKRTCEKCGLRHEPKACPAFGKKCNQCGMSGHFARRCQANVPGRSTYTDVRYLDQEEEPKEEVFAVRRGVTRPLSPDQLVTLKVESGSFIRFQPDTGAQCNVLPSKTYQRATRDMDFTNVTESTSMLIAYGGARVAVIGETILRVWRGEKSYLLRVKLVDHDDIRPILGRRACIGMNIVQYIDNDQINEPATDGAAVFATEERRYSSSRPRMLSKEDLFLKFPSVFADTTGEMDGEYHIKLDETVMPVQHAPRKIPVAIREKVREKLEELEKEGIIQRVTEPTPWISSMVEVVKPNGKIRICLDPRDLNKAVQRENYHLPTVEDIATRLHGAKVFTKLDVRNGFWHVRLDDESALLTTFHTPFGRFCWRRLPFGLSSAPEVFQRRIHEVIEGLPGEEVVEDYFLVVGCGKSMEKAEVEHDKNLLGFLRRCEERNLVVSRDKLLLRETKVPFIDHVASQEGLSANPAKVEAIMKMPAPTDKSAVQRLLQWRNWSSASGAQKCNKPVATQKLLSSRVAVHQLKVITHYFQDKISLHLFMVIATSVVHVLLEYS